MESPTVAVLSGSEAAPSSGSSRQNNKLTEWTAIAECPRRPGKDDNTVAMAQLGECGSGLVASRRRLADQARYCVVECLTASAIVTSKRR